MRVGIDARYAFHPQQRGIGRTLYYLLESLVRLSDHEYVLYLDRRACSLKTFQLPASACSLRVLPTANAALWEQVLLPLAAASDRLDLLHCPANMGPVVSPCPVILTLYDVIEFRRNTFQSGKLTLRHRLSRTYRMRLLPTLVRSVERVITCSEYSARDIRDTFKLEPKRVTVVPLAISPQFLGPIDEDDVATTLEKYAIHGPYVLGLAALDERKNTAALVRAFEILRGGGLDGELVLVGSENVSGQMARLGPALRALHGDVVLLQYVSDEELKHLYHAARVFVYPSLYEGFGLPPLEAMACGTPVACSNVTSLPEVVGDAAMLFDPRNPEDIADKIRLIWQNPALAQDLRERGLRRVREFSWDLVAKQVLDVYAEVGERTARAT